MSNLYPDNAGHRPYPCEHGATCIDPAYHDQYHHHQYGESHSDANNGGCNGDCHHHHCDCDNNGGNGNNTDISAEYNGLPRYDHPHPHPHPHTHSCKHKYRRSLIRDEEVSNIIRVESRIIESLLVKLYNCVGGKDVFVKMELGMKYSIKWIAPNGVNECTGTLVDFKASQHSTVYQPFNADGYYLVMDCSKEGKSDIKRILISMIRDIVEVNPGEEPDLPPEIIDPNLEDLVQDVEEQEQVIEELQQEINELKADQHPEPNAIPEDKLKDIVYNSVN